MDIPQFPDLLPQDALAATDPDAEPAIDFAAVPRRRQRRNGWTEKRQREFIAALAKCGSVSAAAKAIGMTARSAYRLLDAEGADDFARAWDDALDIGMERLRCDALERAISGAWVPVYRRGKLVKVEHRKSDRLAIAMLSGRPNEIEGYRRTAVSRRLHRQDMAELDAARAERDRRVEAAEADYQAEADRLVETVIGRCQPRIVAL
ncbi:hypothetical protein [Sphingomonas alba]|uniref:Helix-turn-helix domain-containing protein n=1 Tax=Sphingomonas alba TaxID=2908208 RepID=A0ABT0RJE9_9SPHN|nr:hypothetical protein [Sphingomonas alba]MCL6682761.1 hypothetical protein [Sphingomonas alba]